MSKTANNSSCGYYYQTVVTLFQAISMVCKSDELLSFWSHPKWDTIVEEGADDIDMQSTGGERYLMQVKYRVTDTISLSAETSDYFKHIIYHLRIAARNRELYLAKKIRVEYWSFAEPASIITEWQASLKNEGTLSGKVVIQMKNLLKNMLNTKTVKKALKDSPGEIESIENFLDNELTLTSFLTSHYIRCSILWRKLLDKSENMLSVYIKENFPQLAETKDVAEDLYCRLHQLLAAGNIASSDVEISRQPLNERQKRLFNDQQKANEDLRKSPNFSSLISETKNQLKKKSEEYSVYSSGLTNEELALRILKEQKRIGLVEEEIRNQKLEKALNSVEKRTITVTELKTYIEDRVRRHIEQSGESEFKYEIEKHLKIFREWKKKSVELSPAKWYIDSVAEALSQLQEIISDENLVVENRAKLLSGWFSQLCLQYGNVPDDDRKLRHEREQQNRRRKITAAEGLREDLQADESKSFTAEKLNEMKEKVNALAGHLQP